MTSKMNTCLLKLLLIFKILHNLKSLYMSDYLIPPTPKIASLIQTVSDYKPVAASFGKKICSHCPVIRPNVNRTAIN